MDLTNFVLTQTFAVAIIMGLAQIIKQLGLNAKFIPLIDVVLGIILGIVFFAGQGIQYGIVIGIILGLEACGLFSGGKNVITVVKGE